MVVNVPWRGEAREPAQDSGSDTTHKEGLLNKHNPPRSVWQRRQMERSPIQETILSCNCRAMLNKAAYWSFSAQNGKTCLDVHCFHGFN